MDEIVSFCVENGIYVDSSPYVALDGSKIVEMTFSRTDEDGTKYFTIKALISLLDDPGCINSIIKSICSEFKLYSQTYRDEIKKLQEQIDLLKEDIKHKDELLRKRKYELRAVHRTFAGTAIELSESENPIATEVTISQGAFCVGQTLTQLDIPENMLIMLIERDGESFIPNGQSVIMAGDKLYVISDQIEKTESFVDYLTSA